MEPASGDLGTPSPNQQEGGDYMYDCMYTGCMYLSICMCTRYLFVFLVLICSLWLLLACFFTVDFRNFIVLFFGPRPWHIEIRYRVKKTSTINLFGFETLKLKIRRLKSWKPTVIIILIMCVTMIPRGRE